MRGREGEKKKKGARELIGWHFDFGYFFPKPVPSHKKGKDCFDRRPPMRRKKKKGGEGKTKSMNRHLNDHTKQFFCYLFCRLLESNETERESKGREEEKKGGKKPGQMVCCSLAYSCSFFDLEEEAGMLRLLR